MSRPHDTSSTRWGFAPRIGVLLLLLSLVPLIGLVGVGRERIVEANDSHERAADVEMTSQDVSSLVELQGSITDEMNSTLIIEALASLGIEPSVVRDAIGIDLEATRQGSAGTVDGLVSSLGLVQLASDLEGARVQRRDLAATKTIYRSIIGRIDVMRHETFQRLQTDTIALSGGEALVQSVRALDAVAGARQAAAEQLFGVFTAEFGVTGADGGEIAALVRQRDLRTAAMVTLGQIIDADSSLAAAARDVENDPDVVYFSTITDATITDALLSGAPTETASLAVLQQQTTRLQDIYTTGIATSADYGTLVERANNQVRDDATALQIEARRRSSQTILLLVLLALSSLIAAAVATLVIVRPLNALRRSAEQMRDGHREGRLRTTGPIEVRAAAAALNEAADHLELVTLQAQALGAGDMDSPIFDSVSVGGLGEALQAAVTTLRVSMAKQSEFQRLLAHEATHDGLTHLPNRRASMAQLTRCLARTDRARTSIAVMFVDLDGFKHINDQHGHQTGDAVLVEISRRLLDVVRTGDHIGRLGGDEFVVIAEPVTGVEDSIEMANRIVECVSSPIQVGALSLLVGASVGIAVASDSHLSADELIRDADLAVYKAKASGRGAVELCDEELRLRLIEDADLNVAITEAIRTDQFELHFQPIVDRGDSRLRSLEALIRWRRPGVGQLVAPDGFIPFAERSALIIDIDRWVLDSAARQIAAWSDDPRLAGVPVAVNISPRHLDSDLFVTNVFDAIERHGVDPEMLIIEVTENAIVSDLVGAAAKLQQLRSRGVTIAIDDFGTGYTSLAHLRALPVDILKIDRSFVAGAGTNAYEESIVRLIIDTGHLLGATITAEGIETDSEARQLTSLGTDTMQGYYFARPTAAAELGAVLDRLGDAELSRPAR